MTDNLTEDAIAEAMACYRARGAREVLSVKMWASTGRDRVHGNHAQPTPMFASRASGRPGAHGNAETRDECGRFQGAGLRGNGTMRQKMGSLF
jgi:hypothetical protein